MIRYSDKNGRSVPDKGWENNIMGNSMNHRDRYCSKKQTFGQKIVIL